ncbi:MAG: D-glycerate dehydrogenase [Candidatus Promineifilaceae bacterium]|nr:D-glycerate dehydrogenase [Candidatus Promineifilaceae bacterium]
MSTTDLPLVIVSHQLPEAWLTSLEGACRFFVGPPTTAGEGLADELMAHLPKTAGLLTLLTVPVEESLLAQAPALQVVSNMAVGVDNIDLAACTARGIPVGHTPGVLTESTADLALALLLAVARRLPEASRDARAGKWTTWLPAGWLGADLHGATLGIVGLGKIGTAVAVRARAFGLRLLYTNRSARPELERQLGATRLPLDELLRQSDFVSLHVPLSAETRGLIDAASLRLMKPTAVLINTARGPVIDSAALERALREGWIAAAGLDVTDPEPLPADHPLYQLENCLILPHIGSATRNTRGQMAELACTNLLDGLAGRPLTHCANPAVYDA